MINIKFLIFKMISYHNPLTSQQIDIFPVLDGNTLKHAIHKRSDAEYARQKIEKTFEAKIEENSLYFKIKFKFQTKRN